MKFLITKLHMNLKVMDLSDVFHEFPLNDVQIRTVQEPIIIAWNDYIFAKDRAFHTRQIKSLEDDQIVWYNNTAYLLTEKETICNAVNHFWELLNEQSYKELLDAGKEEEDE